MTAFHELVWDGYISGQLPLYSKQEFNARMADLDQLSISGYATGGINTALLNVQVEQSFDGMRWMNRNLNPEIKQLQVPDTTEATFSGHDGNPSARPTAAFARLRIQLVNGDAAQVRIWASGRDPEEDDSPLTILGPASIQQWCRSDIGVILNGSTVSTWTDSSGAFRNYTQGTASKQPAFVANAGPKGTPAIMFDGSDDELVAGLLGMPAPGTTPTYIWLIMRQDSPWTSSAAILGADVPADANNYCAIHQNPVSPQLRQTNSVAQDNGGLALGAWGRVEVGFTNSTSDFIKCRSTSVTGTNTGNNSGSGGRRIGKNNNTGTFFSKISVAEIVYANRIPSAVERAALDAYCTARYGSGLV